MRPSKNIPDPNTGKRTLRIEGIGYHKPTKRYRIRYRQGDKWIAEYFPITHDGLRDARHRRAELDRQPTLPSPTNADLGPEMTLIDLDRLGYVDREVPSGAILVNDERVKEPVQINPEWLRTVPTGQREAAVPTTAPARILTPYEVYVKGNAVNPPSWSRLFGWLDEQDQAQAAQRPNKTASKVSA